MQLLQTELSDSKQQVDQLQSQTKTLETSLQTIQVGYAFKNLLYSYRYQQLNLINIQN